MTINAWTHTDDWAICIGLAERELPIAQARFIPPINATTWFTQASDEDILDLVRSGWGGDYDGDAIDEYLAKSDPRITELLDYCETVSKYKDCGWEFYVNHASAKAWLAQHRPHLLPKIEEIEASL